jgi:hypothetical protein
MLTSPDKKSYTTKAPRHKEEKDEKKLGYRIVAIINKVAQSNVLIF